PTRRSSDLLFLTPSSRPRPGVLSFRPTKPCGPGLIFRPRGITTEPTSVSPMDTLSDGAGESPTQFNVVERDLGCSSNQLWRMIGTLVDSSKHPSKISLRCQRYLDTLQGIALRVGEPNRALPGELFIYHFEHQDI